jgi:ATP-dependent Clp protease ATP-binding subunit ClpA
VDPQAMPVGEFVAKFTRDLTELAKQGKIDPVIGRDEEIRRTIQVALLACGCGCLLRLYLWL